MKNKYKIKSKFFVMRKGRDLFAGDMKKGSVPILISNIDLILLKFFARETAIELIIERFYKNRIVKLLYSNVSAEQLKLRIQYLIDNRLVLISAFSNSNFDKKYDNVVLAEKGNDEVLNLPLRLTSNFCITVIDGIFKIWSTSRRCFFQIDEAQAFVLVLFLHFDTVNQIISETNLQYSMPEIEELAVWFLENGILVDTTNDTKSKVNSAIESRKEHSTVHKRSEVKTWLDIPADNREPVYFFPHTANHYPLGLGLLYTSLMNYQNGKLAQYYNFIPITYLTPTEFLNGPYRKFGRGLWFFSNYMWSVEINLKMSDLVKRHDRRNITIHGGPSTPEYTLECKKFLAKHSSVDICVHGEGEVSVVELLSARYQNSCKNNSGFLQKLDMINGITYKDPAGSIKSTEKRTRMKRPDNVPSPYLFGAFNSYNGSIEAAIIETNRGCPFGCTFCDWGSATNQKVQKYDMLRIKGEIDWIASQSVRVLWIADANFGMYDRDIEIAQYIANKKQNIDYPKEVVVNYTKNTNWRLAEIIKIFSKGGIISQGVISIQTTDDHTLKVINRRNIKTSKYDELSKIFRDSNLPLSTDLMIGLPGSTVEGFKTDLQRYFDKDISVKAYRTQLLPNSPMAAPDYINTYKIEVDDENYLASTFSYTPEELNSMMQLYELHKLIDGYSLLRYVARFLQWEHGIVYRNFLGKLQKLLNNEGAIAKFPHIYFAFTFFETDKCMPGGWQTFYCEIREFCLESFSISSSSSFETVLEVNELAMPDDGRAYPFRLELEHDFISYFKDNQVNQNQKCNKLSNYSSSVMIFDDPYEMAKIAYRQVQYDSHQFFWEVESATSRPKNASKIGLLDTVTTNDSTG